MPTFSPSPFDEQPVVIIPELALLVRALRGFGRPVRFPTAPTVQDRIVLVDEFDLAGLDILFVDSTRRVDCKIFAVRSLEVGVFDEGHFGVGVPRVRPTTAYASAASSHQESAALKAIRLTKHGHDSEKSPTRTDENGLAPCLS